MAEMSLSDLRKYHSPSRWQLLAELFQLWRKRSVERAELAHMDERELHDIGLSPAMIAYELNKPFWRA
jgi:uncharacterized protein YjiS (DUF1127 family)